MSRLGEVLRSPGVRLRLAVLAGAVLTILVLLFLARFRPSWPWFSLWLFGLLGGLGVLSLPRVRVALNLSWFAVTLLTLLGVLFFDLYLFHVETHRQRSERLEVRGVFFEPEHQPIRLGAGYPGLDVRLEGSFYDFDRWSLELRQVEAGRYLVQDLNQVDMLRVPGTFWWNPWGRAWTPAIGGALSGRAEILEDSASGESPFRIRLLARGEGGTLAWRESRAPLALEDPLLNRRLSRGLSQGIPLSELHWDSVPDQGAAGELVLTRVRPGISLGRIPLRLPEYRLVSRSQGERFRPDSLPTVQDGDTLWVTSRGKTWAFSVDRIPGVSRVSAPIAIQFVRRPRASGWALPSSEACGDQTDRCAVLSTRSLPPPQPHFDLSGFGLDTARYSVLARLETDREEVRLVGADYRVHFSYGELKPIPALPAQEDLSAAGILVRVDRAAQGQQSAVLLTVGALFFLILGALISISGDPAIWHRRKATTPSVSAAWAFVNVFLIFLGIRLALGLRVAYSPPFYDRGADTAVGLWITFALMMVALGRWSSWAPTFWGLIRRLEHPISRIFLPGVNGNSRGGRSPGARVGARAVDLRNSGHFRFRDRFRSVLGLVFMGISLILLLWQRPGSAPSLLVAVIGVGAWLAMGISRRRGHSAILNRAPLGVITSEGDAEEPSLALGMAAGASVILALAIHAPWMALLPVAVLIFLFLVNFAMGRWGPTTSPTRRAWILYGLILIMMEVGVLALLPWPEGATGIVLVLGAAGALVLGFRKKTTLQTEGGPREPESPKEAGEKPAGGTMVTPAAPENAEPPPRLLERWYAAFSRVGTAVFSGVGWVGVLLILGVLAFLSAQAIPPFVRFALVFMLFLLAIRAGLACRQVLDRGSRRGSIQALGLLVIPLGVLLVFMLFDFGLGLVFFVPMFLTVLLSARIDRLPGLLMAGSGAVVLALSLVAWSVLRPSLAPLRAAPDIPTFSEEFQEVGNGLVDLLRRAGMNGPVTRASIRSMAASDPELLEEALAFAGPGEALLAAAPSRNQVWGGRAYAASGLAGTGFAGTPVLGRGVPTAVSYAENSYAVYILSEHGALGGVAILMTYLALLVVVASWVFRVHETIQDSRMGLAVLAMTVGGVLWLVLPAVYVAASNLALVPLTGQNMPFLGLNSWADVVLVSGLATGIVFGLIAVEEPECEGGPA